ncbi:MAG: hypothetical protein RIR70_1924 [Pseudomonadota bacterium]|jgi:hypothetical protein
MNRYVMTMAAGVYMVSPMPGLGDVIGTVANLDSHPPATYTSPKPVTVIINGDPATLAPANITSPAAAPCVRARTWSFAKMLAKAFNDECRSHIAAKESEKTNTVIIGSQSS